MKDIWIGDHFQNFRISLQYSTHLGKKILHSVGQTKVIPLNLNQEDAMQYNVFQFSFVSSF